MHEQGTCTVYGWGYNRSQWPPSPKTQWRTSSLQRDPLPTRKSLGYDKVLCSRSRKYVVNTGIPWVCLVGSIELALFISSFTDIALTFSSNVQNIQKNALSRLGKRLINAKFISPFPKFKSFPPKIWVESKLFVPDFYNETESRSTFGERGKKKEKKRKKKKQVTRSIVRSFAKRGDSFP